MVGKKLNVVWLRDQIARPSDVMPFYFTNGYADSNIDWFSFLHFYHDQQVVLWSYSAFATSLPIRSKPIYWLESTVWPSWKVKPFATSSSHIGQRMLGVLISDKPDVASQPNPLCSWVPLCKMATVYSRGHIRFAGMARGWPNDLHCNCRPLAEPVGTTV
jgi:hypothetical protein